LDLSTRLGIVAGTLKTEHEKRDESSIFNDLMLEEETLS
jgi:hypothetical protein